VLPVASLGGDPALASPEALQGDRIWPVLIHTRAGRKQGLVVDAVDDIVEWDGDMNADRIVVRDRITDLLALTSSEPGGES